MVCAFAWVDDVARCFPRADEISTDTRLLDQNYQDYHSCQILEIQLLTELLVFRQLPKHEEGLNAPPGPSSGGATPAITAIVLELEAATVTPALQSS